MKIIFWSNVHGQAGTTSNLLAIAMMNDILYSNKSVLLQTQFRLNQLEIPLLNQEEREYIKQYDIGLDTLIKGIRAGINTKEMLKNCCISLTKNCTDFLPGTNYRSREVFEGEMRRAYHDILELAEECYDYVFVDANVGTSCFMKQVWQEADLLIVSLSQNKRVLDDLFASYKFDLEKTLFVIGNYDAKSQYNLHNLTRMYKALRKDNTMVVPYNTEFRDAASESDIVQFMYRNMLCEKGEENYTFINEVRNATRCIMEIAREKAEKLEQERVYKPAIGGVSVSAY